MSYIKNKNLSFLLVLTLLLSILTPNLASAYNIKGSADSPTLTIHKFQQEPGTEVGEPGDGESEKTPQGTSLKGVTFTLTLKERFDPSSNQWSDASPGKEITGTTDDSGKIVFSKDNGLELGRYEVKETNGPDNIILNAKTFNVDVPMTNATGDGLNYNVHIYPKNEIIRGKVILTKHGADNNPLKGVEFKLFKNIDPPEQIGVLTTNDLGEITVDSLEQGKYYFEETNPAPGYALNNTKVYFEVIKTNGEGQADSLGQEIRIKWDDVERFAENGIVTNNRIPKISKTINEGVANLNINRNEEYKYNLKVELPKDIDLYSEFKITDQLDSHLLFVKEGSIKDGWQVSGIDAKDLTFSEDGQTLTWVVNNFKNLAGKDDFTITFTSKIKADATEELIPNNATLGFNNNRGDKREIITPTATVGATQGGFEILKVDKADNAITLGGADFKLTTDEAGKDIVKTKDTSIRVNGKLSTNPNGELIKLTTEDDGKINVTGLSTGIYYLHETKAPTYSDDGTDKSYRLLTKPVKVEITDSPDLKLVKVENSKSGWNLPTTGGMGTLLFTLIGLALMGVALITYLRNRKDIQQ